MTIKDINKLISKNRRGAIIGFVIPIVSFSFIIISNGIDNIITFLAEIILTPGVFLADIIYNILSSIVILDFSLSMSETQFVTVVSLLINMALYLFIGVMLQDKKIIKS